MEKEPASSEGGARDADNDNGVSNERGNVEQCGEKGLVVDLEDEPSSEGSEVGSDDSNASQARGRPRSRKRKEKSNSQAAGSSTKRKKRGVGKVPKADKHILVLCERTNNIWLAKICGMFWLKMFLFPVCQC